MSETTTLIDAAVGYARRGWHVFPCHTPTDTGCSCTKRAACRDVGKHPRTRAGLSDASTDEAQIRKWWKTWPHANIAIRTGAISGLVALDVDIRKGGADSLEELERAYHPLLETVQSLTGNGQHYAFAHPGTPVKNGVETLGAGLDIRGDGGYIIAPPSLHANGKRYTWEILHEPDDTPLMPMPPWLLALCQATPRREQVDAGAPIPQGSRNDTLFRLGCSFRAKGCTEAVILAALREMNAAQCQPPLPEAAVATLAAQCGKYAPGPGHEDTHQRRNGDTPAPAADGPHAIFIDAATVLEEDITWLWDRYIARKKLHALDGDPGIGKTLWALQLAASVSRGYPMPDQLGKLPQSSGAPERVLLMGMEDGLGDTVIKRLNRAGADLSKMTIVNEVDEHGKARPFLLSDLPLLEQHMAAHRPALVYIDAIQAVLGGRVDINRANQVTALLLPLRAFAERYNAAILFARHPAKPGQNVAKLIHRGMGSQAFIGTVRLGLFVEEHPCDPTKVLLVQSKSNAGDIGRTQIFSKRGGQFEWCGVTRINKEMMAGGGKGPSPQAFLETCFWLEARLHDGRAYLATDLQDEMKEEGFTHGVTFAAKKALGIVHTKTMAGTFTWHLPPLPDSTSSTSSTSSSSSTSSTSYSSINTIDYGDQGQPSHVSDVDEVDDVYEVDAVVTAEDVAVLIDPLAPAPAPPDAPPPPPCYLCTGEVFWRNAGGQAICSRCHPQPQETTR